MKAARESFYAARDSRTTACAGNTDYRRGRVVLSIDDAEAETACGQIAFLTAANLLARWCRDVRFVAPIVDLHPRAQTLAAGISLLGEGAASIAAAADPFGHFNLGAPSRPAEHQLHVGARCPAGAYPVLGRGWTALGGGAARCAPSQGGQTVLGAVLAGCAGTAQLFRAAQGQRCLPSDFRLSLWNLRGGTEAKDGPDVSGADLGLVYLVGCGAVGSAIAYLLPLAQLLGTFVLVDRDTIDDSNLNRSPLFTSLDVGKSKAVVTAAHLLRNGLAAEPYVEWFDEAVRAGHVFLHRPDLVIPAANDRNVRHCIQDQIPPLQIYGTTGRNWDAFLGRHIPLQEDCLACRFPSPKTNGEPPLICATAAIPAPPQAEERQMDAALPFLSTAAGLLAVAELLKVTTQGYPASPNFACLDFLGDLSDFVLDQRRPKGSCRCALQSRIWAELNGASRFSSLSTAAESPHDDRESWNPPAARHTFIGAADRGATCGGDGLSTRPAVTFSSRTSG